MLNYSLYSNADDWFLNYNYNRRTAKNTWRPMRREGLH